MSDEKKGDGKGRPEPIRVKQLFFGADRVDVPGMSLVGAVTADAKYKLDFLPWLRHHRITWARTGGDPVVRMVHESKVTAWEPL